MSAQLDAAQLPRAPQPHIEEWVQLLDQLRFEQQGTDFAGGLDAVDVPAACEHLGFVFGAQVREHPAADVDALADVQRQRPFPAKNIDPGPARQRCECGYCDAVGHCQQARKYFP